MHRKLTLLWQCCIAFLSVFFAFGLRWLADPLLGEYYAFHFFFLSVFIAASFARIGPALFAMVLGGFLASYFFVEPRSSFLVTQPIGIVGTFIYYSVSGLILYLVFQTKRQKKQLREKSVWLQRLIDTSPDILFVYDVQEKRNTFISKETHAYLGYQPEQILALGSQVLERLVHPEDLPQLMQVYQQMDSLPDTTVNNSLVRLRHTDGSYRTFHTRRAVFSRGEDGRVKEITGTMREITALQQIEEELRKSEERFRLVNRATHDVIWDWDLTTGGLEWNESVETAFGYSREDLEPTFHGWYERIHPADRECAVNGVRAAIDAGAESWAGEYRFLRRDGAYAVVLDRGFIARDREGKAYRMIGSMLDLTERMRVEEALRRNEAKWNAAIEHLGEGVIIATEAEQVIYWNPAARELHGFTSAEEGIGPLKEIPNMFQLWTLDNRRLLPLEEWPMRRIKRGETIRHYEIRLRRPDQGWERIVSYSGAMVETASGERLIFLSIHDLTEQRKAEAARRESDERLRFALEACQIGAWDIDLVDRTAFRSLEHDRIFGYAESLPQWTLEDFLRHALPEYRAPVEAMVREATAARTGWTYECPIRRVDGEIRWIWFTGRRYTDISGHDRVVGVVQDITERKQAEMVMQESRAKLETALASIIDAVIITDAEGRLIEFNDAFTTFHRFKNKDECARTLAEYPDILDLFMANEEPVPLDQWPVPRALRGETGTNAEYTLRRKDTGETWVGSYSFGPIRDQNGAIVGSVAVGRDVTERKQAEQALRESQMHYRTLFNSIDEGFCIIEVLFDENEKPIDYRLLEVNPAFEQQTGLLDAQGKRVRELVPNHDEHWFEIYGQVALTGQSTRFQNRAEQLHRWYDVYAFRFGEPENRQVAVLFNDITEHKQWEEALREADRHKDEFLAILGHELRNPLAAITTAVKLLNRPNPDAQKEKRFKNIIEEQAQQLDRILSDLLDVSRIARGKIKLEIQEAQISEVMEKSLESVREACQERRHHLSVEGLVDRIAIAGDPARLQQIVVNLLGNACKYTPEGGRIRLVIESEENEVVLRVIDNGVGIPLEAQSHIFDLFVQVESSKQRSQGGLGIGLSLAKMLTELHGGSISVRSEGEGKGSELIVRLPKGEPVKTPMALAEPLPFAEVTGLQVLVVEDNLALAHMLVDTIEEHGHGVQHARDGLEALSLARQRRPDVVLLDIGLPKMDGWEVARRLRNELDLKDTLIVATTAWGQEQDRQRSAEAGIDHHLVKPVDYAKIAPLISRWHPHHKSQV